MVKRELLAATLLVTLPTAGIARDLVSSTPASLLAPGELEAQLSIAVYTQTEAFDDGGTRQSVPRATYTTGTLSITVGRPGPWNPGVDLTMRSVRDEAFPSDTRTRTSLTAIHPRVAVAPWRGLPHLALETGIRVPVAEELEGSSRRPYLDWADPIWTVRLLWDARVSYGLFAYLEAGTALRVDPSAGDAQLTTPFQAILNWVPNATWTVYVPLTIAPDWIGEPRGNYWSQVGLGVKLRPRSDVELEALATVLPAGRNAGAGRGLLLGVRVAP